MAGVKVTLLRTRPDGASNVPIGRLFEGAKGWLTDTDTSHLLILREKNMLPSLIAEFPLESIESVEFV